MEFSIDYWKGAIKGYFQQSPNQKKKGIYTSICLATGIPLIAAFMDPTAYGTTISSLIGILSGIGGNLVATELERWLNNDKMTQSDMESLLIENLEINNEFRTQYDHIIQQLNAIDTAQKMLSKEDKVWFHQTLKKELSISSPLQKIYLPGGKYFEHIEVIGDINIFNLNINPDYSSFIETYYQVLQTRSQQLPLGILDSQFTKITSDNTIELHEVYTELDVVSLVRKENESDKQYGWRLSRAESSERKPLLEAIIQEELEYIILLGETGSGKTTFLNYLTYLILSQNNNLPEILSNKPVIRLLLRNVTKYLTKDKSDGHACMIWNAIKDDFIEIFTKETGEIVFTQWMKAICSKPCIVLLDGLDEVPESNNRRHCLLSAIDEFSTTLKEGSRILVSTRPYAYAQKDWNLIRFQSLAIAPLNINQIRNFISAWYHAFQGKGNEWNETFVSERKRVLLRTIFDEDRAYLGDLATKPVLLTLMVILHASSGEVPDDRAILYESVVDLLLKRWQRQRISGNFSDIDDSLDESIRKVFLLGEENLRKGLENVAYSAHKKQQKADNLFIDENSSLDSAEITRGELLDIFSSLYKQINPMDLIEYLEKRAGLIVSREDGIFIFPHRSFQEFLSACYILNFSSDSLQELIDLVNDDQDWWRDVFLFAIGRLKKTLSFAISLINMYLPLSIAEKKKQSKIDIDDWKKVTLAGESLLELHILDEPVLLQNHNLLIQKIREWLTEIVNTGIFEAKQRLYVGEVLGKIGDFRKGVNIITLENVLIPDIDWIRIPKGTFLMGSTDDDLNADQDEKEQHSLYLPEYLISKYPITNVQYETFVKAKGYENSEWWSNSGSEWRNGTNSDLSETHSDDFKKYFEAIINFRSIERRNQPFFETVPLYGGKNHPVVGINWFEANAFANWFSNIANYKKIYTDIGIDSCKICLPSEAEWEKAVRGTDGKRYPWGKNWKNDVANIENTQLGNTNTVGMFPKGKSKPFGLLDCSGNVWEWTRSIWGDTPAYPIYHYPYVKNDGREDDNSWMLRIVRGGSWIFGKREARCAYRLWEYPDYLSANNGFRIVLLFDNTNAM